jgi:hypothetical protein
MQPNQAVATPWVARTCEQSTAGFQKNVLDAHMVCQLKKDAAVCKELNTMKKTRLVRAMQVAAERTGFRTVELAINSRKNNDQRKQLARCNSLQEQIHAAQPGVR